MNYPGETVTISHMGFNMDGSISSGGVGYFVWQGDTRTNFVHEFLGGSGDFTGLRIAKVAHHVRMQRMTVRNFNSHGISGAGTCSDTPPLKPTFIEVLDNEIRNNGDNSYDIAHEHGIYPNCGDDWLIDGNYLVGNFAYGIHINAKNSHRFTITRNTIEGRKGPTGTAGGIYITGGNGHIVMNNLIIGKGAQAFKLTLGVQVGPAAVNPLIYNNTVYDVQTGVLLSSASGAIVQNNLISAVTTNIHDLGNNTKASNLCTVVELGCSVITASPKFTSAGSNFRLASGSLAIDAGATLSIVTHDLDRGNRPIGNAHDIGAFESGSQTSPRPPMNLQVK
jgi:nitrous oxidase accessory protein NosD